MVTHICTHDDPLSETHQIIVMQEVSDAHSKTADSNTVFDLSGLFSAVGDRQEARGF